MKGQSFQLPQIPHIERRIEQFHQATKNLDYECLMLVDPADGMIKKKHTDFEPGMVRVPQGYGPAFILHSHPKGGTPLSLGDFQATTCAGVVGNMSVAHDGTISWCGKVTEDEAWQIEAYGNSYICGEAQYLCKLSSRGDRDIQGASHNYCCLQHLIERGMVPSVSVRAGTDTRGWQAAREFGLVLPHSFSWSRE